MKLKQALLACLLAAAGAALGTTAVATPLAVNASAPQVEVSAAVRHASSPPLRELAANSASAAIPAEKPLRSTTSGRDLGGAFDPVVQTSATLPLGANVLTNFLGLGTNFPGFVMTGEPSDANGAVGATQFVEWVNTSFAVFSKTGGLLAGPTDGNALFESLGGPCATNNDGDPIAQYDKAADRWVLTQFSVTGGPPFFQCVAVSQTADATGAYNLYAFEYSNFNDGPKLGVWPDSVNNAYFISYNMFSHRFLGAQACGLERAQMLAGGPARQVCFQQPSSVASLLPSDLDGATVPPVGSPGYFVNFGTNSLNFFKFHVNWANPAASTFTGPASVSVPAFAPACKGRACIQQPNTRQLLDSLADRLMYRLAYRNFGTHESLLVNHSVNPNNGTAGTRWYELQNARGTSLASGSPVVVQASTYAPDGNFRWMGSVAMDKVGDMAIGYSVSSSSVFPSIAIAGRRPSDVPNTLRQEVIIVNGIGSQAGHSRWGDYSSMSVDPADDCTFWYTTQFVDVAGVNDFIWSTQVASFKFPGCI